MANTPFTRHRARLATDRFDFQAHINGEAFRQKANTVDLDVPIAGLGGASNVQQAIDWLATHSGGGGGGGGVINLSDLTATTGILPIVRGGTGLSSIGGPGTVLSSDGSAANWSLISNSNVASGAAIAVSKLANGSNNTVLTTVSGSTVWSNIIDANISNSANIAVSKLAAGTDTFVLTSSSGTVVWSAASGGGGTVNLSSLSATSGILPIVRGGTGLSTIGGANTVLTSNGTSASWASIINADISNSAAVAVSKLANGTDGNVLTTAGGVPTWANIADTNVSSTAAVAVSKLAHGTNGQVLTTNGTTNSWNQIADVNVASGAAIAVSKLAPGTNTFVLTTNGTTNSWAAASGGSSTGQNLAGAGVGIYAGNSGSVLQFNTIAVQSPLSGGTGVNDVIFAISGLNSFGAVGQSIRVGAAGNVMEWFSPGGGGGGFSAGPPGQVNTADGMGGWQAATDVFSGTDFLSIGAIPASVGGLRLPNNSTLLAQRNQLNNADLYALVGTTTDLWIASDPAEAHSYTNVHMSALTSIELAVGGTAGINISSGTINYGFPRIGDGTPYASEGQATISIPSGSTTLTSDQYSRKILKFTSSTSTSATVFLPGPPNADSSYEKVIRKLFSNTGTLIISTGTGTTFAITPQNGRAHITVTPDGVSGFAVSSSNVVSNTVV